MSKPSVSTIPFGATWTHFHVPVGDKSQDILLSFPTDDLFALHPHPYFGATIGRVANRIDKGIIPDLNGRSHQASINEHQNGYPNTLHGGSKGWDKKDWTSTNVTRGTWDEGIRNLAGSQSKYGVLYSMASSDGDEGLPGTIQARTYYYEGRGLNDELVLDIEYEAELIGDEIESTVIGMTNHAYFNLNGPDQDTKTREENWTLDSHTALLATSSYLKLGLDTPGIPTGELGHHPEVPYKANTAFSLTNDTGKTRSIDDCFVLPGYVSDQSAISIDSRSNSLTTLAIVKGDRSGIALKVQSTEPAFQFYTGEFIDVKPFGIEKGYGPFAGFCIEPSRFVNAAGRKEWRSQVLLRKGEVYGARSRYWAYKE